MAASSIQKMSMTLLVMLMLSTLLVASKVSSADVDNGDGHNPPLEDPTDDTMSATEYSTGMPMYRVMSNPEHLIPASQLGRAQSHEQPRKKRGQSNLMP